MGAVEHCSIVVQEDMLLSMLVRSITIIIHWQLYRLLRATAIITTMPPPPLHRRMLLHHSSSIQQPMQLRWPSMEREKLLLLG